MLKTKPAAIACAVGVVAPMMFALNPAVAATPPTSSSFVLADPVAPASPPTSSEPGLVSGNHKKFPVGIGSYWAWTYAGDSVELSGTTTPKATISVALVDANNVPVSEVLSVKGSAGTGSWTAVIPTAIDIEPGTDYFLRAWRSAGGKEVSAHRVKFEVRGLPLTSKLYTSKSTVMRGSSMVIRLRGFVPERQATVELDRDWPCALTSDTEVPGADPGAEGGGGTPILDELGNLVDDLTGGGTEDNSARTMTVMTDANGDARIDCNVNANASLGLYAVEAKQVGQTMTTSFRVSLGVLYPEVDNPDPEPEPEGWTPAPKAPSVSTPTGYRPPAAGPSLPEVIDKIINTKLPKADWSSGAGFLPGMDGGMDLGDNLGSDPLPEDDFDDLGDGPLISPETNGPDDISGGPGHQMEMDADKKSDEDGSFPWWIAGIAGLAVVGGGAVLLSGGREEKETPTPPTHSA